MADLELTLTWLGMDRYLERFIEAGFDSWATVLEITENDLDILNVDLDHRRKLQREIANTKRLARDPAFVTPLYGIEPPPPTNLRGISSSSNDIQQGGVPTKRGYRHHPKADPKAPERPYSAYVLFSNHTREQLKEQNLSFTDLSKVVGEKWQQLTRDEREEWKAKGGVPWERYKAEVAKYQKTDDFQDYKRYLTEFKAAQAAKGRQKRPSTTMQSPVSSTYLATNISPKYRQMAAVSSTGQAGSERKYSKVAIKRLKRDEETWNQGLGSGTRSARVRQACESCRNRKIKCHGEQPTCRHCRELGEECNYASGKRDRRGRQDDDILQKLKVYEDLLLKLVPQVDDDDQQAIQDAILMPPQDEAAKSVYKETIKSESYSDSHGGGGESDASGVGSMGPTDHVDQDDMQQRHVPAFVGQSSETKWTEKLSEELLPKQGGKTSKSRNRNQDFSHQNASQRLGVKEPPPYAEDMDSAVVGHQIDPFSLPVKPTADSLVNSYFSTIHLSFPILDKMVFIDQYNELYSTMDPEGFEPRTFVATLQLVFAIAAVHAHLIQADWTGDARDHMLYFSQARVLAVDTGIFNDDCYLSQVRVFGLGGMYLLVTNQLNRAWNLSGLAIRSAQALGLHLKDVSGSVNAETKEFHAYNWFALVTLESMLTLMTGRPNMINPRDCSVIIPRALAEGKSSSTTTSSSESLDQKSKMESRHPSSNSGGSDPDKRVFFDRLMKSHATYPRAIYFVHYVELCELTKEAVGELYQPGIRKKKWSEIQSKIDSFDTRLFEWKDGVKPPFNVASPSLDPETESCRVALRILFHSTRTIINRPCLCRMGENIQDQSSSSAETNRRSAKKCVDSARATLSLILHKPDSTVLHEGPMWWMLMHHLKRALTVLLLELAFRAEHMPADVDEILAEAKAAVNWLNWMGRSSPEARRSWSNMRQLLRLAAQKVGGDTSDIMTSSEEETAPIHLGHQQPPLANFDNANQRALPRRGLYGGPTPQEQWQYYGDLNARNEWDQFEFLRAEGGMGSLFPAANENERLGEGQGEDDDMEGSF